MGLWFGGDCFRYKKRWVQGYEEIGSGIERDGFRVMRRLVQV